MPPPTAAARGRLRGAVLLGQDADAIAHAFADDCPIVKVADMNEAVVQAAALAMPGDTVLLSPACASLDMYVNYAARGEAFIRAIGRLDE